jgi:hypothetical protein
MTRLVHDHDEKECLTEILEHFTDAIPCRDSIRLNTITTSKLFYRHRELQRFAKRDNKTMDSNHFSFICLFGKQSFKGEIKTEWGEGIYFLGDCLKTALVVITCRHTTPKTLWLRLLGKGKTLQYAIETFAALPQNAASQGWRVVSGSFKRL